MVDYKITTKTIIVGYKPTKFNMGSHLGNISAWCREMFGEDEDRWWVDFELSTSNDSSFGVKRSKLIFCFNRKEDAVLFKMRWL